MQQLIIAFILIILTVSWLIFRRLSSIPPKLRVVSLLVISILFLRPLAGEAVLPGVHLLYEGGILIGAFSLFLLNCLKKETEFFLPRIDIFFLLFIMVLAVSTITSVNKESSINQVIYFLSLYLWYWTIINLPSDIPLQKTVMYALCGACLFIVLYALYQYNAGFAAMRRFAETHPSHIIQSREFMRRMNSNVVFATFLYPPSLAAYLNMLFLTILGLSFAPGGIVLDRKTFHAGRLVTYLLLLLIIPVLILTKSKGSWGGLLLGILVFFLLQHKSKGSAIKITGLVFLFAISFRVIGSSHKIHLPGLDNITASLAVRQEYWKAALAMVTKRPLLGFGPGTFGSVYPLFKTKFGEETFMAHNSFLQIWAEGGSVCLIVFLCFWAAFFLSANRLLTNRQHQVKPVLIGIYCALISFLFHNLVDFSLYLGQVAIIAFALLGIFFWQARGSLPATRRFIVTDRRKKIIYVSLAAILLGFVLTFLGSSYAALRFDNAAGRSFREGDLKKAAVLVEKAIAFNFLAARLRFHKAMLNEARAHRKDLEKAVKDEYRQQAITDYKKAIELDPFLPYYHFRLGNILVSTQRSADLQQARLHLEKAASLYPVNPFYHEQLAAFYVIIGEHELAEKEKQQGEELRKYFKKGTR